MINNNNDNFLFFEFNILKSTVYILFNCFLLALVICDMKLRQK